jgi:hypothetical protein
MFDAATALSWQDRIDNYARVMKLPVHMAVGPGDRLFGIWNMGNDYRVSSGYYGGYPATYQRRVKALFPDKLHVLHLFSGKVDLATCPGDTVDINPSLSPTYLDDAQTLRSSAGAIRLGARRSTLQRGRRRALSDNDGEEDPCHEGAGPAPAWCTRRLA